MGSKNKRYMAIPQKRPLSDGSLLEHMADGKEYESLLSYKPTTVDVAKELRLSLAEVSSIRERPVICYISNVVNNQLKGSRSIDSNDDLPFAELVATVPTEGKVLDVILVTPGGSGEQVAKFVDKLRPRFDNVTFILPYMAMSAGTIMAMSGNEIIMGPNSYIGPTDPQVPNRDGLYVPAQAIVTLLDEIQKRGQELLSKGQQPLWSDLQLLRHLDAKEIGNAMNASAYSMELVEEYLYTYKFKDWTVHKNGQPVTDEDKKSRAKVIASYLCSHAQWKTHSRGITRDVAWSECKIKIVHTESIPGLERAIRRFWAATYWTFENTAIIKAFLSQWYGVFRNDPTYMKRA